MPRNESIRSVLIIGSGPIVIGQACEFDYSGSQASLSLKEEGIEVAIINSNPDTIMTDKVIADHIYLRLLTNDSIAEILELHRGTQRRKQRSEECEFGTEGISTGSTEVW